MIFKFSIDDIDGRSDGVDVNDDRPLLVANVQFNLPLVTFAEYASICDYGFKSVLDERRKLRRDWMAPVSCDPRSPLP